MVKSWLNSGGRRSPLITEADEQQSLETNRVGTLTHPAGGDRSSTEHSDDPFVGTTVRLPDEPPARKGAKPKPRTAIVVKPPFALAGYLLVEKCDRPGQWWIPARLCRSLEG